MFLGRCLGNDYGDHRGDDRDGNLGGDRAAVASSKSFVVSKSLAATDSLSRAVAVAS